MDDPAPEEFGELIARAREQDESAMAALLEAHSQRLLDSIRAELGDRLRLRLESQDVMQQVYLDALRDIRSFEERGGDSFFAWLRRIAVNRICDFDRKAFQASKRSPEVRAADLGGEESVARLLGDLTGSGTTPSMAADQRDRVLLLERALSQLGEAQREAIDLRYMKHLSVAEAAVRMNRTERAVRGLCVRGLIRLRELLGDAIKGERE